MHGIELQLLTHHMESTKESLDREEWDGSAKCLLFFWLFSSNFFGVCKTLVDPDDASDFSSKHNDQKENHINWHCVSACQTLH